MAAGTMWAEPRPLDQLRAIDLAAPDIVFAHDGYLYRTFGENLARLIGIEPKRRIGTR